ncbi:hypothetical protein NHQ30_002890 [Ciborinia camelliae]|nr:hypothetical protein NHQ30_002890 [Ciborinia camelliae]
MSQQQSSRPRPASRRSTPGIPRCPGGTPKYEFRKEFLTLRPSVTEDEVRMVRGTSYKPLRTFANVPAGTKKPVRITRPEYCAIRDWRAANGVAPFKAANFDSKWGWNHKDAWDVYYSANTGDDPAFK